jgi:hypothetical protein
MIFLPATGVVPTPLGSGGWYLERDVVSFCSFVGALSLGLAGRPLDPKPLPGFRALHSSLLSST